MSQEKNNPICVPCGSSTVGANMLRGTNARTTLGAGSGLWANGTWRSADSPNAVKKAINVTDAPTPSIVTGWNIVNAGSSSGGICQGGVPVAVGQKHTLSCYARGNGDIHLMFGNTGSFPRTVIQLENAESWTRYSYTFQVTEKEAPSGRVNIYFEVNNAPDGIDLCGMKLELGAIPAEMTWWVPAFEDLQA